MLLPEPVLDATNHASLILITYKTTPSRRITGLKASILYAQAARNEHCTGDTSYFTRLAGPMLVKDPIKRIALIQTL